MFRITAEVHTGRTVVKGKLKKNTLMHITGTKQQYEKNSVSMDRTIQIRTLPTVPTILAQYQTTRTIMKVT